MYKIRRSGREIDLFLREHDLSGASLGNENFVGLRAVMETILCDTTNEEVSYLRQNQARAGRGLRKVLYGVVLDDVDIEVTSTIKTLGGERYKRKDQVTCSNKTP